MSTPAQKANLARIRDNQRRSRARKREYLQELEQRLRICEHQGIEASAEVQIAARRVAEENIQLRALLNKQGVTDEYIAHYLQASLIAPDLNPQIGSGLPGPAVQALQQLLVPRRPNPLDPSSAAAAGGGGTSVSGTAYSIAGQTSREASVTSASTSASSLWESPPQGHGQGQMYSSSGSATPRVDSFVGQSSRQQAGVGVNMMEAAAAAAAAHHGHGHSNVQGQHQHSHQQQPHHQHHHHHHQQQQQQQQHHAFSQQQVQAAIQAGAMGYANPNVGSYHSEDAQNYGTGGGYC